MAHIVTLEKTFAASTLEIFELFENTTVFRLTGASHIQVDFRTGGLFCLTFNGRGIINGQFIKITTRNIIIEWNVDGFQRPKEIKTLVEISLRKKSEKKCVLTLHHKNISDEGAAAAKQRAWTEILDDMEYRINNPA